MSEEKVVKALDAVMDRLEKLEKKISETSVPSRGRMSVSTCFVPVPKTRVLEKPPLDWLEHEK